MKAYNVKIKNTDERETIRAGSDLEAKVRFCEENGLAYRVFADKLQASQLTKDNELEDC
jgi:hypothetical protein